MIGQEIVYDIGDTIFVVAKIDQTSVLQGLDLILQRQEILNGMALYPIMIITSNVGIIPMGIWWFHRSEWNAVINCLWINRDNNSVYDTRIGSTGGVSGLASRGLLDWLFTG